MPLKCRTEIKERYGEEPIAEILDIGSQDLRKDSVKGVQVTASEDYYRNDIV